MLRLFLNIIIFLSIFFLPAYITALVIIASIFIFNNFIESMFWAFIIDILYGGGKFFGGLEFNCIFVFAITIIFLISFRIKKILIFYPRL